MLSEANNSYRIKKILPSEIMTLQEDNPPSKHLETLPSAKDQLPNRKSMPISSTKKEQILIAKKYKASNSAFRKQATEADL